MAQMIVKPNTSLLYSGGMARHAEAWRAEKNWRYKILWGRWRNHSWPEQWVNDVEVYLEFYCRVSRAFAQLSAGDVYVMLPNDSSNAGPPESVWHNHEWPHLRNEPGKENAKVERVLRLSPNDFSKAEVIYERTKGRAIAMPLEGKLLG
jgi:hypothetical protein